MRADFPPSGAPQNRGHKETNMLEYMISGANVVLLAGCLYIAYLILVADPMHLHISRKSQKTSSCPVEHELLFRKPCADYYI
jgi:hypothetical protein